MENFAKFLAVLVVVPVLLLGIIFVANVFIDINGLLALRSDWQSANVAKNHNGYQSEIGRPGKINEKNGHIPSEGYIVTVKDTKFTVDVADTVAERRQGLSGRDPLPSNHGLLFIFDESDRHGIWMKDMRFAIDIIWLGGNKRAVDIRENVKPETYPETFYPRKDAIYVIEVPAGFVERNNIRTGDFFVFTVSPPSR